MSHKPGRGHRLKPPRSQRRFGTIWGELEYVCARIRYWLYERESRPFATRYLVRLTHVLKALPDNDLAIIREEALALRAELTEDIESAIAHREREIKLMEKLHRSVHESVKHGR
jgi:hypothetical protein